MKKVHLVFDYDQLEDLASFVSGFSQVTGKDFTLDTAATWAASGKGETPDIILIDGTVDVVKVDIATGKQARDKLFVEKLTLIRTSRPDSQLILLLPPERENDIEFLQSVINLAIFDIYFIETIDGDDLQKWFNTKKNISDVRRYLLPGSLLQDTQFSTIKTNYDKENANDETKKESFLGRFFNPPEARVEQKEQFKESPTTSKVLPIQETPTVVLGLGNQNLNDWFKNTFSGLVEISASTTTPDEFKQAVGFYNPDIVIIMRPSPMGGLPEADVLAKWATHQVHAVLFIAGELDEQGTVMADTVKSAGGYVLSCPQGETISGDELVYLMQTIIRELNEADTKADNEEEIDDKEDKKYKIELDHLKSSVSNLTKIFKEQKKKPSLSLKARIINSEGLSLEEEKDLPVAQIASHAKNPTAIVPGGLLAIVTPWRPALAGRLAAAAVNMFAKDGDEVAVIGASGCSTVSMWLDISDEELIMSDWRVPGSQAPLIKDNLKIWAVDPAKRLHMKMADDLLMLIKEARKTAVYTVVDYADDFELAQKAAFQGNAVVLVIVPWSDPAERKTTLLWLNQLMEGKQNIVPGIDLRGEPLAKPEEFTPKVVVRNYPANAILEALKKNSDDEFVWV
ncbi:hypothetical protein [Desulfofalx alkaliphila]|uniref:hypothetical protein n=1 Tax=Desulfofalx alkaliphila TaxID=105483 RepID=UPI0004E1E8AC|nr:hypothetical protein [Desulfofalx alkaliphila]